VRISGILLGVLAIALAAHAAPLSKTYQFKPGVVLEIGVSTRDDIRLVSVEFVETAGKKFLGMGGNLRANVVIANSSENARKVGVAIALFDAEGRLVGVASGGSKYMAIKPERQSTYDLTFQDVGASASQAATFQISIEPK
jgi:hypothetical protein